MKKTFVFLIMLFFLGGCYTVQQAKADKEKQNAKMKSFLRSHYEFSMTLPKENSILFYQDSIISCSFVIGSKSIDFSIKNQTKKPIKLIWNEASLGLFGRSNRIMHAGVKYIDRNSTSPPSIILPNTRLEDLVLPTDNVYYEEGYFGQYFSSPGSWKTSNLLLPIGRKKDLSQKMVGQLITLYLPIQDMESQVLGYTFQFKVTGVVK